MYISMYIYIYKFILLYIILGDISQNGDRIMGFRNIRITKIIGLPFSFEQVYGILYISNIIIYIYIYLICIAMYMIYSIYKML